MQFQYTARTPDGQMMAGLLEAPSPVQAQSQLRDQGLFPVTIDSQIRPQAVARQPWGGARIRKADLLMVTSQLSIMCQAGIDLAEALRSVAAECRHPGLKSTLDSVYQDVRGGTAASVALKKHGDVFGQAYVTSIAAAEASGSVTEVLSRLAGLLRNEIRLRSSLKSVAAYPIVLLGVAGIVLTALVFFVLPQFADVFEKTGRPAPPTTALLLDVATLLRENVLIIAGFVGLLAVGGLRLMRTEAACRYWDGVVLNAALFRNASRALLTGRAFRLMGTMLESGVPLLEAVRMCRASVRNRLFRGLFDDLEADVVNGKGIGSAIRHAVFVPAGAAQMISTAERTGKLGTVMELIGEYYEEEGERLVRQVVKLLEPAIIVVMGVLVAGVVLSVMLPLLDVSTMSR